MALSSMIFTSFAEKVVNLFTYQTKLRDLSSSLTKFSILKVILLVVSGQRAIFCYHIWTVKTLSLR